MRRSAALILFVLLLTSSAAPQLKWVALGDSITYLNDHTDETGDRVSKGYMTMVTEQRPSLRYVNKGFNGWTCVKIASEISTLGLEKADVYSVFLGTNDWWQGKRVGTLADYKNGTGNSTFFGAYRTIINTLRKLNKDAQLFLITPMQRVDFVYIADMKNNAYGSYREKDGQKLSQFADAVIAIGKYEKIKVVDLYHSSELTLNNMVKFKRLKDSVTGEYVNYKYPDFIGIPFEPEKDEYPYPEEATDMTYDGLHPSDKGYKVISSMILDVIKK